MAHANFVVYMPRVVRNLTRRPVGTLQHMPINHECGRNARTQVEIDAHLYVLECSPPQFRRSRGLHIVVQPDPVGAERAPQHSRKGEMVPSRHVGSH